LTKIQRLQLFHFVLTVEGRLIADDIDYEAVESDIVLEVWIERTQF
jgi:hypothetical protein